MNIKLDIDCAEYPAPEVIKAIETAAAIVIANPGLPNYEFPIYLRTSTKQKTDPEKEWLTLTEVAKLLGKHPATIRRRVDKGKFPAPSSSDPLRKKGKTGPTGEVWKRSEIEKFLG